MKDLLIDRNAKIKDALSQISKKGIRCLVVVDKFNKMMGSLSDGDIRRAIIDNGANALNVKGMCNYEVFSVRKGSRTIKKLTSEMVAK